MKAEIGDKVRLKTGTEAGARGIVAGVRGELLLVRLEGSGRTVELASDRVTNYSLAARKAWRTEPDRRVGRPKGLKFCDRVSVTLRIDRDLWKEFQAKEAVGLIPDRTEVINAWLREKLAALDGGGGNGHAQADDRGAAPGRSPHARAGR